MKREDLKVGDVIRTPKMDPHDGTFKSFKITAIDDVSVSIEALDGRNAGDVFRWEGPWPDGWEKVE